MRKELSSVLNESNFSLPELLHVVHKYKETTKTTRRKKLVSLNDLKRLAYHANLIEQPKPTVL